MSFLQIILIGASLWLTYIIVDAWRHKKLRFFHAFIAAGGVLAIVYMAFNPDVLTRLAQFTGVERGADFIVYTSLIFLCFVFFSLLQHLLKLQQEMTRLCTATALRDYARDLTDWHSSFVSDTNPKSAYCFLIRAYNEEKTLGAVIDEIVQAWFNTIVVCDDGSQDSTAALIAHKQRDYPHIRIIALSHPINRGPGAANKTLFAFASRYGKTLGVERFVTYDADGQMNIKDMETFMAHADGSRFDVIIGSRFVQGGSSERMPVLRRIILWWSRIVTYIFNGIWLTDVSTGYRMYNAKSIRHIHLVSDRFGYQNDIVESIRMHHLSYIEIPVHIIYTDYSLAKWQSNMSAFRILINLMYQSVFYK